MELITSIQIDVIRQSEERFSIVVIDNKLREQVTGIDATALSTAYYVYIATLLAFAQATSRTIFEEAQGAGMNSVLLLAMESLTESLAAAKVSASTLGVTFGRVIEPEIPTGETIQ